MKFTLLRMTAAALVATGATANVQPFVALRGSSPPSSDAAAQTSLDLALGNECTDLGEAAAEHVVKDGWCAPDGAASFSDGRFPSNCREVAYGACRGTISDVADRWCPDINMKTSDLRSLQGECEDQVNSMVGGGGGRCVDDDRPRPVRDGQRFRFNLVDSGDAQCVDDQDRGYEWGEFGSCTNFSECAERCVNDTLGDLAFAGGFRGFDFDCSNRRCRCLYDAGTLDSRNSGRFDRSDRNLPGEGSISGTARRSSYYCGKLVGADAVEEVAES